MSLELLEHRRVFVEPRERQRRREHGYQMRDAEARLAALAEEARAHRSERVARLQLWPAGEYKYEYVVVKQHSTGGWNQVYTSINNKLLKRPTPSASGCNRSSTTRTQSTEYRPAHLQESDKARL